MPSHSLFCLAALFAITLGYAPAETPAAEFHEKDEVFILRDVDLRDGEKIVAPIYAGKLAVVREIQGDRVRVEYGEDKGWINSHDIASRSDAWKLLSERIKKDGKDWQALRARSRLWLDQKKYDQAAVDLEAALAANPRDAQSWRFQGMLHLAIKDYDKAIAEFSEALRLDPQILDGRFWRINSRMAKAGVGEVEVQTNGLFYRFPLWNRKSFSQEVRKSIDADLQEAYLSSTSDNKLLQVRAYIRLLDKEYEGVISDASKAIRLNPREGSPLLFRAAAFVDCKRYTEAVADLDEATKRDPTTTESAADLRCAAHLMLGDLDSAIADVTKSLNCKPLSEKYCLRAVIRIAKHRPVEFRLQNGKPTYCYAKAFQVLELRDEETAPIFADFAAAERLDASWQSTFEDRGLLHLCLKQYDEAIADISEAIRLGSTRENFLMVRAEAYSQKGQYSLAYADITKAAERNPQDIEITKEHASVAVGLNKFDDAMNDFARIIEKDPTCENFAARGTAWILADQSQKAAADLDRAIELDPKSEKARVRRGVVYCQTKQFDQGIECFDEALRLNPKSGEAYAWRSLARFGELEYDKAFADAQKAIELAPTLADGYLRRGMVYLQRSKNKQAAADFERALTLTPTFTNFPVHLHRIWAYVNDGQIEKAISCADESLRKYPGNKDLQRLHAEVSAVLASRPASKKPMSIKR